MRLPYLLTTSPPTCDFPTHLRLPHLPVTSLPVLLSVSAPPDLSPPALPTCPSRLSFPPVLLSRLPCLPAQPSQHPARKRRLQSFQVVLSTPPPAVTKQAPASLSLPPDFGRRGRRRRCFLAADVYSPIPYPSSPPLLPPLPVPTTARADVAVAIGHNPSNTGTARSKPPQRQ